MSDDRDVDDNDAGHGDLWASDALLDALGAGAPVEEDRAAALLSALVSDVSAQPLPALPLVARRRRSHRLAPRTGVAAAAVVAMLSTGGVAAASVNAGPTSPLFPLHRVLTGQPQLDSSQRQALEIKDRLKSATRALASGKVARAQQDVASAADRLPKVAATDGHKALAAAWTAISRQVKARASATPTAAAPKPGTVTPTPTHSPTQGRSPSPAVTTTTPAPTSSLVPVTSIAGTTSPGTPAAGAAPTSGLTSPSPAPTTPTPSTVPSTTPSPSDPATTGSATPTPSVTPSRHHKPGPGRGGGGSVAPGAPPSWSLEPPSPSQAPVTVPPASQAPVTVPSPSQAPVTVPPASDPAAPPAAPASS